MENDDLLILHTQWSAGLTGEESPEYKLALALLILAAEVRALRRVVEQVPYIKAK